MGREEGNHDWYFQRALCVNTTRVQPTTKFHRQSATRFGLTRPRLQPWNYPLVCGDPFASLSDIIPRPTLWSLAIDVERNRIIAGILINDLPLRGEEEDPISVIELSHPCLST